jgi:sigma-B regulation protein RsbU (phosphoserine phosphatase)
MGKIAGIEDLRLKLLVLLLAFALVPVVVIGVVSVMEMNQASKDVQEKISGLSSTLNRSALTAASNEADQVQIAVAKASQYDEFFRRIRYENEIVAKFASDSQDNQSCEPQVGIWIAPLGSNGTLLGKMKRTLSSLCVPSRVLRSVVEGEPASNLGYIGTEDGVMVTWPDINETLFRAAPLDHRNLSWYITGKRSGNTAWTKPYIDSNGFMAITCVTAIHRGSELFGVAGMNISLGSIYGDLSSQGGRGYSFIIDESGTVVMRSTASPRGELGRLFGPDNFYESNSSEIRELVRSMLHGETGSAVISLGKADGYVAFAPITALGWSYGIAYPAEEMSLPARFIDAGIRDTAKSVTQGLTDAVRATRESATIVLILTGIIAVLSSFLIGRKIEGQARNIADAAEMIRNGDLDIAAVSEGGPRILGDAFSNMADSIKHHLTEREAIAKSRGGREKELEVWGEIKRSLRPGDLPQPEGYEIAALSIPSVGGGFDFCDVMDMGEDKIALYMAEVSEGGIAGAMLAIASKALIRSSQNTDPSKVLSDVNLQIGDRAHGMNLACFYAVLDIAGHTLKFVNAGFNPVFIMDSGGSVDTLGGGGIALGVLDRLDLRPEQIPVQPGDVLIVYSDGVTKATNAWRKQQGAERLITLVKENRALSASKILEAIEGEMRSYIKDHLLQNDSMLVILKRL